MCVCVCLATLAQTLCNCNCCAHFQPTRRDKRVAQRSAAGGGHLSATLKAQLYRSPLTDRDQAMGHPQPCVCGVVIWLLSVARSAFFSACRLRKLPSAKSLPPCDLAQSRKVVVAVSLRKTGRGCCCCCFAAATLTLHRLLLQWPLAGRRTWPAAGLSG